MRERGGGEGGGEGGERERGKVCILFSHLNNITAGVVGREQEKTGQNRLPYRRGGGE